MTMEKPASSGEVYQFHVLLLGISPAIWRRLLIGSTSSMADLHHILQIVMGWDDCDKKQLMAAQKSITWPIT